MASKLLYPDLAGHGVVKAFHQSSYALAGLIPASLVAPTESIPAKVADAGLSVVVPFHGYVGLSYIVSDYLPKAAQVPVRVGLAGVTAVTVVGLLKVSLAGPGIGGALKQLWTKPSA